MSSGSMPQESGRDVNEFKEKRKLVLIKIVDISELPVRVMKRRTGVTLAMFENMEAANGYIETLPMSLLTNTISKKKFVTKRR